MNIGAPLTPRRWSVSLAISLLLHVAVVLFILFGPSLGDFVPRNDAPEVMMVRLRGGGENLPGWIKPTTAPPDDTPVPDNKPKPVPESRKEVEPETPAAPEPETVADEAPQVEETVPPREPEGTEAVTETDSEPEQMSGDADAEGAPEAAAAAPVEGETGEGIGNKPGPEGPGFGASSDADFPGADTFLSRVEAEVQRRFNFRGRGTGAVAEYHFYIDRRGKMQELLLMSSSGINSLDMSARSALIRAKFPPLPAGFSHEKLGVTYRFHDAR